MALTFKGGVHIEDYKDQTKNLQITPITNIPKLLYFPLQQHIGSPLSPTVKIGDFVKVGQVIADSDQYMSVPLHSSVSGIVKDIGLYPHPLGTNVTSIVIENDNSFENYKNISPLGEYTSFSQARLLEIVRNAGIVGMGGAGFPTHIKLNPPKDKKIDYVIINGAECEPYLTSDHRIMLETPDEVIYGLKTILHILGLKEGYIGIENNKLDAIEALNNSLNENEKSNIHIVPLKTKYPQGSEKHMIKAITKRNVPSGKLPSDVGVVVINVDTACAISRVLKTGMPLIRRVITVSGDAVKEPKMLCVPIGVPFEDVFAECGGFNCEVQKIIMGGPMMGIAQHNLYSPVVKGTSGLLAFSNSVKLYDIESNCLKCAKCVEGCPMRLMPLYIKDYSKNDNLEMCEKHNATDCIECGLCSYICPSRQHPLQYIRLAKAKIIEMRRDSKNVK